MKTLNRPQTAELGELDLPTLKRVRRRVTRRRVMGRAIGPVALTLVLVFGATALLSNLGENGGAGVRTNDATVGGQPETGPSEGGDLVSLSVTAEDGTTVAISITTDHELLDRLREDREHLHGESVPSEISECAAEEVVTIAITSDDGSELFLFGASERTEMLARGLGPGEQIQRVAYARVADKNETLLLLRTPAGATLSIDPPAHAADGEAGWHAFLVSTPSTQQLSDLPAVTVSTDGKAGTLVVTSQSHEGDAAC